MNDAITPFILAVPQADLEDLNRRIDQTRWPDAETVHDWTGRPARQSQGADRSPASLLRLAPLRGDSERWHDARDLMPSCHRRQIRSAGLRMLSRSCSAESSANRK